MSLKGWLVLGIILLLISALWWVGVILLLDTPPIDPPVDILGGAIITAAPIGIGIYALWRSRGLKGERFCPECGFVGTNQYCPNDGTEMKPRQA